MSPPKDQKIPRNLVEKRAASARAAWTPEKRGQHGARMKAIAAKRGARRESLVNEELRLAEEGPRLER